MEMCAAVQHTSGTRQTRHLAVIIHYIPIGMCATVQHESGACLARDLVAKIGTTRESVQQCTTYGSATDEVVNISETIR